MAFVSFVSDWNYVRGDEDSGFTFHLPVGDDGTGRPVEEIRLDGGSERPSQHTIQALQQFCVTAEVDAAAIAANHGEVKFLAIDGKEYQIQRYGLCTRAGNPARGAECCGGT